MSCSLSKREAKIRLNTYLFSSSGINFNDVLARYGLLEDTLRPPFVPGFECSGEVLSIGPNVTNVNVSRFSSARNLDHREMLIVL